MTDYRWVSHPRGWLDAVKETDRRIAGLAERQHSVVTSTQLAKLGVSRHEIAYRLEHRRLLEVYRGVYRLPGVREYYEQRVMAACLATGGVASQDRKSVV
jgi:hypothetical protein